MALEVRSGHALNLHPLARPREPPAPHSPPPSPGGRAARSVIWNRPNPHSFLEPPDAARRPRRPARVPARRGVRLGFELLRRRPGFGGGRTPGELSQDPGWESPVRRAGEREDLG